MGLAVVIWLEINKDKFRYPSECMMVSEVKIINHRVVKRASSHDIAVLNLSAVRFRESER